MRPELIAEILADTGRFLVELRASGPIGGVWQATQLKTEADLLAQAQIGAALRALSPALPVVSEEDVASHGEARPERYWLIDPIDGTASYAGGFTGWVTQAALMEHDQPVLGAVFAPALDRMYLAERGSGAFVNGRRLAVAGTAGRLVLTDNYPQPRGISQRLHAGLPCTGYLESGSIGMKICRVADGEADLFVKDVILRDWDLAPGELILAEAGGRLVDLLGRPLAYVGSLEKQGGIIAAGSTGLIARVRRFLSEQEANES